MNLEVIPNTGISIDDCKKYKMVRTDNGMTYYHITLKNKGGRCKCCGKYTTKCKDLILKTVHHDQDTVIYYSARRLKCECGKTFYENNPFSSSEKNISDHLIKRILEELKRYNHTFLEVAQRFQISVTKVIEIFDTHVQIKRKALREVISIDEFYFSRHARNKYAFMILGLNGEIIDILESRRKSFLLDYFKYIPVKERQLVKYVTMDMNRVYKEVISRRFNNAIICIDSFHVMKMMNDELDKIRKKIMHRSESYKYSDEYYLLKHRYYVLFRDDFKEEYRYDKHFRMHMNEYDYLNLILKTDKELSDVYSQIRRYYYFNHYWNEYTRNEACQYLERYIKELYLSNNRSLISIASTLDNWKKEIANSFIPYIRRNGETVRLSNGRIEGKNSYIKKMIHLANGFSNFERFRNRTMYSENHYETYSEDKLPNIIKRHFPKKKKRLK